MIAVAPLALLIALPLYAQAAPAPIVFDFEDGLQGWTLGGSAQRVQTQVLGGEWAILGDGFVSPGRIFAKDRFFLGLLGRNHSSLTFAIAILG